MPQLSQRIRVSALVLIALSVLSPLATAQPQREAANPPAERAEAARGLFAQLRSFLSILWAANGSGLDPDGTNTTSGTTGDNGSGLDPNGRR